MANVNDKSDSVIFELAEDDNLTFFSAYTFAFQADDRLSLAAKGLLAILLSFGKGWKIYMRDIAKRSSSGRYTLRHAVKELETTGYLTKQPIKGQRGRFVGWNYKVYQKPKPQQTHENQKSNRKTALPHSEEWSNRVTAYGKPANDKYLQQTNKNNPNNKQQHNAVVELKNFGVTEAGINDIAAVFDMTMITQLLAYAKKNKLGPGWILSVARDPAKRPPVGLLTMQNKNKDFGPGLSSTENAQRMTAFVKNMRNEFNQKQ